MLESAQPGNDAHGGQPHGPQVARTEDPPADPDPVSSQILRRACGSTQAILAAIRATDLDRPTPCASWAVRDVVNHMLGSAAFFADLADAGAAADGDEDRDFAAGDFNGSFMHVADRVVAAFNAPGAMDQIMKLPIGDLPGSVCVWIAAGDIFAHGWDLAKATGQPTDLEPELAGLLLAQIMQILPDAMRGPDGQAPFGPRVEVDESARPADRLVAFLGRRP